MQFRKGFLFVLAAISLLFIKIDSAEAKIALELPLANVTPLYDYKKDPFALQWTFVTVKKSEEPKPVTKEEKLLDYWKKKQAQLWEKLPQGKFVINASAYTAAADECGKNDGITASGLKVAENRTLACPPAYPFGTKINIEGVGELRCEDRGGAIKGNKFDIYMETKKQAFTFGRRNLVAEVVK